jgi:hypothetical protein
MLKDALVKRRFCQNIGLFLAFVLSARALGYVPTGQIPVEVRHGTIMVWEETPNRIIVVADSAMATEGSSGPPQTTCKIVTLSKDTIFFYTGNLFDVTDRVTGSELFSQRASAIKAFDTFKADRRTFQRLMNVATKYSEVVSVKMNELFRFTPNAKDRIGLAGFASLDESAHPRLVTANIPITVPNNGATAYTGKPDVSEWRLYRGTGFYPANMGVIEFLYPKSERAKQAMRSFEARVPKLPKRDVEVYKLIAGAEASLEWNRDDPTIGPPVDALVIESGTGI